MNGTFGLIATNTIRQGDTRSTGLRWICQHGGEVFMTRKRLRWPGLAAVVVSVIHVRKGRFEGAKRLDGREVPIITAFLFHRGGHEDPRSLIANTDKSFVGSYVLGMGFTFDDTDKKGTATSIAELRRLIEENPRNQEVIFPYIGGDEVNSSPTHAHHRYVINFGEKPEQECRERWPRLMDIVEAKVRPGRQSQGSIVNPNRWWRFARPASNLSMASNQCERVLVVCRHQPRWSATFMASTAVFAESLVVVTLDTYSAFCALQSRPHEIWVRFFGSSFEDRLRYTPSDCFETFAFLPAGESHDAQETAGQIYYDFRSALMVGNGEGLTKTYNRFHDPEERAPEIVQLRELHAAMDRVVLDAYGWTDIPTDCEFLLDHEIDEETWGTKKRPYRYRWPEEVHDAVLARLLDLNQKRYAEEVAAGLYAEKGAKRSALRKKTQGKGSSPSSKATPPLFETVMNSSDDK